MLPQANTSGANANKVEVIQPYPCVLEVLFNGVPINGLVDTGASSTCLDASLFEKKIAGRTQEQVDAIHEVVRGAGNHRLRCLGQITLVVTVPTAPKREFELAVLLIDGLGNEALLGRDFIVTANLNLQTKADAILCELPAADAACVTPLRKKRKRPRKRAGLQDASNIGRDASAGKQNATGPHETDMTQGLQRLLRESKIAAKKRGRTATDVIVCKKRHSGQADATPKETNSSGNESTGNERPTEHGITPDGAIKAASGVLHREKIKRSKLGPLKRRAHKMAAVHLPEGNAKHNNRTEDLSFGGEWGEELVLPDGNFADDPLEDRENPYIYKEKTRGMQMTGGVVDIGLELTENEENELKATLARHRGILAFEGQLGDCAIIEHSICTGDAKPINVAPFARARREREAVDAQISDWLNKGLIRESSSPWAARIVTVRKKDNTIRCCVDYRALNSVTQRNVYPLPTREDILSSLEGKGYFSSLDLNQGYMQIRVREEDIPKTAFVVQSGFYEFTRMPFGLTNAPATFQYVMDKVLAGLKWKACLVYLDDIIVFGRDLEEHHNNLVQVFERIKAANLTLKPSKCAFAVSELKFLGHILSKDGVRMDPDKVRCIEEAPQPTNIHEIRSFIGLASYYRNFVKDFAKISEPLTRLTRNDVPFEWTSQQEEAFQEIKRRLTSEPTMCHFNHNIPVELRTDASGYGLGAVLLHLFPNGEKKVISYASRLLTQHEKNYGITEKECLAIVWAVEKFRIYLQGIKFRVVTDHLALTWLQSKKELTGRLMRWANKLQPYHFEVFYKSGKHHQDADFLSRYPLQLNSVDLRDANQASRRKELMDAILAAQRTDPDVAKLRTELDRHPNFGLEGETLVRLNKSETPTRARILVPDVVLPLVRQFCAEDAILGHPGFKKLLALFNQSFYTPNAHRKFKVLRMTGGGAASKASGPYGGQDSVGAPNAAAATILFTRCGRRGTYRPALANEPTEETADNWTPPTVSLRRLRKAQLEDTECIQRKGGGQPQFETRHGLLVLKEGGRIVVPLAMLPAVLYALHDDATGGHCGFRKTLARFNQRYYIRNATGRIKDYVRSCHLCQRRKQPWTRRYGLLQPIAPARTPFERVGIDTLGPFRRSRAGNEKVIVITDYMTRFALARAVPRENDAELADTLIQSVFLRFGAPQEILSDRGKSFRTQFIRRIYDEFKVRHLTSTAYHPQTIGLVERLNRTLSVMLSMYVNQYHQDWDEWLPYVVFAYNSTRQNSTGYTPYYLLHGFEPRLPSDITDPNDDTSVAEHFERLHHAREAAIQATLRAQEGQKKQYDRNRYEQEFREGDLVWVHRQRGYIGQTTKLRHPYEGPWKILKKFSDLNYLVQDMSGNTQQSKTDTVHVSRLKPYFARDPSLVMRPESDSD